MRDLNFDIDPQLYRKWKSGERDESWKDIEIPKRYNFLFDYQKNSMKYSIYHNNRVLLALDCGLGKSITSLCISDNANLLPTLIVCLSIIKNQWKEEYKRFFGKKDKIVIVESRKDIKEYGEDVDIVIVNYELLALEMQTIKKGFHIPSERLKKFKSSFFGTVIGDEVQKCKNPESKTSQAMSYLCSDVPNLIMLTGTPLTKSSADLYPIMSMLNSNLFSNQYSYLNRYCKVRFINGIKSYYSSRNNEELHDILINNGMFRLTKSDVGINNANRILQSVIPMKIKDKKELKKLDVELSESDSSKRGFAIMNKMREIAWEQKKDSVFKFIDELLESSDEKISLFAVNKKVVQDLLKKYGKIAVYIDGSVSTKGQIRDNIIKKFKTDKKIRVFIGSIGCISTGITGLQEVCSIGVLLQWTWVPSEIVQLIGRLDRTGQKKIVNIYHLVGEGTIEEMFMRILDNKSKMFKEVVDGEMLSEDEMLELMLEEAKK